MVSGCLLLLILLCLLILERTDNRQAEASQVEISSKCNDIFKIKRTRKIENFDVQPFVAMGTSY